MQEISVLKFGSESNNVHNGIKQFIKIEYFGFEHELYRENIENLDGLTELEQLILYGNRIRVIENLDGLGNLKVLKINNNRLLSISELSLYDMHSLEILNAADNIIEQNEIEN